MTGSFPLARWLLLGLGATSLAACEGAGGDPQTATATTTLSAAAPAPTASAPPPPLHTKGPCQGKDAGAHACDGNALVRCGDKDGTVEPVKSCYSIERCDEKAATCAPACPEGEVYIPPTGDEGFTMGKGFLSGGGGGDWSRNKGHMGGTDTPHTVVLTKPFCMDQLEVTVREWDACMKEHKCRQPDLEHRFVMWPKHLDHPVNAVDWRDAKYFCGLKGKTLPTEAQWEWAATGGDGRTYPWGEDAPTCEHADYTPGMLPHPAGDAGCGRGGPSKVGSKPKGAKKWPTGEIHDLAGNVWEWCLDNYFSYEGDKVVDPLVWRAEKLPHSLRGGGWNRSHAGIRTAFRGAGSVDYRVPGLGFRCARNPKEAPIEPPP